MRYLPLKEDGAALVEYAVLLALVGLLCLGAMSLLGGQLTTFLTAASTSI